MRAHRAPRVLGGLLGIELCELGVELGLLLGRGLAGGPLAFHLRLVGKRPANSLGLLRFHAGKLGLRSHCRAHLGGLLRVHGGKLGLERLVVDLRAGGLRLGLGALCLRGEPRP